MTAPDFSGDVVPTNGPLRVDPRNPRYFTDASGRTQLLAGSHTWATLQEAGPEDPPEPFDWPGWLAFMARHGHNFMRLWIWENAKWGSWYDGDYYFEPLPWARTGPDLARDGKPRFDLTRYDQEWFERLRSRVRDCRDRGIYVAVMLFQGWSGGDKPFDSWSGDNPVSQGPNPWHGHPFCIDNNVNGVDASPADGTGREWVHSLRFPRVVELQEEYVRAVIDTVSDFDNVLYEIGNEHDGTPENTAWQYHMTNVVHEYERSAKSAVHPVLMTAQYPGADNQMLYASPAEAVSPMGWHRAGTQHWQQEPPAEYLGKVIVSDTDHLWGVGGTADWVWRTFTRGHNMLYMDPWGYSHFELRGPEGDPGARQAMGLAVALSRRIDLSHFLPRPDLVSTGFALASPGDGYVVYKPEGLRCQLDLRDSDAAFELEWLHPTDAVSTRANRFAGGRVVHLVAPDGGAWVANVSRA